MNRLAWGTVIGGCLGLAMALPCSAAPADPTPPDAAAEVEALLDCLTLGRDEQVRWTAPPDAIAVADPVGDSDTSPGNDITGWVHAVSGPLDDATWNLLFGPEGVFASGGEHIRATSYDANAEAFRGGLMLSGVRLAGERVPPAGADASGVALAGTAPRFPSPAEGPFAGIGRAWRLDERQGATQVNYVQFTTSYQVFRADMFVVDGCDPGRAQSGWRAPGIGFEDPWVWFVVALTGADVVGLEEVRPEAFEVVGGESRSDTTPLASHTALAPGTLQTTTRPPVQPPPESTSTTSTSSTTTTTAAPGVVAPPPTTSTSKDGGNGLGAALIVTGGGLVVLGGVVARRASTRRSVLEYHGTEVPQSVLSYADDRPARYDDAAARLAFETATFREAEVQQRLEGQYRIVATDLANEYARLRLALDQYGKEYEVVLREVRFLQQIADDWAIGRKAAGGIDLLLGILSIASSVASFLDARKVKTAQALLAAEDAAAASAKVQRADAVIDGSEALKAAFSEAAAVNIAPGKRGADEVFREAVMMANEAGVDFATVGAQRYTELRRVLPVREAVNAVWIDMAEAAAASRGWVKPADDAREAVTTALVNVRSFCRGGTTTAAEVERSLKTVGNMLQQNPQLFDELPNWYVQLGDARSLAEIAMSKLYDPAEVDFLRWAMTRWQSGTNVGDLPGVWQAAAGPIASTGQKVALEAGAPLLTAVGETADFLNATQGTIGGSMDLVTQFGSAPLAASVFPDPETYMSQFGLMRPTLFGFEAGDSFPLTLLFNAVNAAGGPVTAMINLQASAEGAVMYGEAADALAPTFTSMAGASVDVLGALDRLNDIVTGPGISLADQQSLRDAVRDMGTALGQASPDLRAELAPQLRGRTEHVAQKLAQIDNVRAVLAEAAQVLPAMRDTVAQQVRSGRQAAQWADPGLLQSFAGTTVVADAMVRGVLDPSSPFTPPARPDGPIGGVPSTWADLVPGEIPDDLYAGEDPIDFDDLDGR